MLSCRCHLSPHTLLPPFLAMRSNNVKKRVNREQMASGLNRQKVIDKARRAAGRGGEGREGEVLLPLLVPLVPLVLVLLLPPAAPRPCGLGELLLGQCAHRRHRPPPPLPPCQAGGV